MSQDPLSEKPILSSILKDMEIIAEWLLYSALALFFPVAFGAGLIIESSYPVGIQLTDAYKKVQAAAFIDQYIGHMLVISGFLGGLTLYFRIKSMKSL